MARKDNKWFNLQEASEYTKFSISVLRRRIRSGDLKHKKIDGKLAFKENWLKGHLKPTLARAFPDIAKRWHPTKNKPLTPDDISYGSGKEVWFLCNKGHPDKFSVVDVTMGNAYCGYCSGQKVGYGNDLETNFPEIAKQWHPTKNGEKLPSQFATKSHEIIWWVCKRGHDDWQTPISNRTKGHGCVDCSRGRSLPQRFLYFELSTIFNSVHLEENVNNYEADILIDDCNTTIEYDGYYWHKNKMKKDLAKKKMFTQLGYLAINIRENPLDKLSGNDLCVSPNLEYYNLTKIVVEHIKELLSSNKATTKILNDYLKKGKVQNEKTFQAYVASLPRPPLEKSLKYNYPQLSKEWHPTKNGLITPLDMTVQNGYRASWMCLKNKHEWNEIVANRVRYPNCPFCTKKRASPEYNLYTENPDLAKEWHPSKNDLLPTDVTPNSHKVVWWLCPCGYEWEMRVDARNGGNKHRGCTLYK